jgi:hypothetical protein
VIEARNGCLDIDPGSAHASSIAHSDRREQGTGCALDAACATKSCLRG